MFDAIVRHSKDIVKKQGADYDLTDIKPLKGSDSGVEAGTKEALVESAQAFLKKVESGAEKLVVDTMKRVPAEQRVSRNEILIVQSKWEEMRGERRK